MFRLTAFFSRGSNARWLSGVLLVSVLAWPGPARASGSKVAIARDPEKGFQLTVDGEPFFIRGAGGSQRLEMLAKLGGNSIRTWGIEQMEEKVDGKPLLDRAHELGIRVTVGIWVGHERHKFDYGNERMLEKQRADVRAAVRKYKDHPAVLMWGLGNEMEGPASDGSDARIWKELDRLARIVKEEDPDHPVMTVIASANPVKVRAVKAHYPSIDVLGVNAYAGASGVGKALKEVGWEKPFALTEFGPLGHWEVPKTKWGAPIEPSSRDKAGSYYATQTSVISDGAGLCLGSYVFLWGQKQEVTSTWYGMFLKTGEKLPTVDATVYAWTGKWPENRCPKIKGFAAPLRESEVGRGEKIRAEVVAEDPEGDALAYEWKVFRESTAASMGGDAEPEPPEVAGAVEEVSGNGATVKVPDHPGAYRLFVTVRDGRGNASVENTPFLVR